MSDHLASDLRRAMREHDAEAPTATDLIDALRDAPRTEPVPAWSRGWRGLVPLAAGAAVAAVIAGSVWAGAQLTRTGGVTSGRQHPAVSPLTCPARYAHPAPWVPATADGVPAHSRLAPRHAPSTALVCAYNGSNIGPAAGWKLSGRRLISGPLTGLAADLAWQPRKVKGQDIGCTLVGGKQVNYLIGLTYPGRGRLWVAATDDPNACVSSSNGDFISFGFVGGLVAEAFSSGRWPTQSPASCHVPGGRLGQNQAMVPLGATSVSICGNHGGPTLTTGFAGLVSALNALPARQSTRSCSMTPHHKGRFYSLMFGYPQGPGVQVIVNSGCVPAIDNGSLQAQSATTILPIIVRLLR